VSKPFTTSMDGEATAAAEKDCNQAGSSGHFDTAPKEWEQPIVYTCAEPEPFPVDIFCRPMRDMSEAVAAAMPCPVDMPAVTMLAAASVAIGSTLELEIKRGWREQARFWLATICRPGSKKSPASGAVLRPIRQRQQLLRQQYQCEQAAYEAALEEWHEKPKKERGAKPIPPVELQAFTSNTTLEALADLLVENPRGLLLHRDELTGWVRSLNQYRGGRGDDKQIWLSYWSGEPVPINRRGRRVYVEKPFLSVSGNLPPEMLGELNDEMGREDGFVHRILFSWPCDSPCGWSEAEPDESIVDVYDAMFEKLYQLKHCEELPLHRYRMDAKPWAQTIYFTDAAKNAYAAFVNRLAEEMRASDFPSPLRGPWSKFEGYCARFALLLHTCAWAGDERAEKDVRVDDVRGAVKLVDYFMAHARRVYPCLSSSKTDTRRKDAEAVLGWIGRNRVKIEQENRADGKPAGAFTWRTVRHDLHNRFDGREPDLTSALQDLEARGYLREVTRQRGGTSGRLPKPDYFVNPQLWCRNDRNAQNGETTDGFGH
jgi:hypothetical protein